MGTARSIYDQVVPNGMSLEEWRLWRERRRHEAELERAANAQLAAALRRLVAALDDDSAMTGLAWRIALTRPPYEDDEPCPLADAWAEVARVCPADAGEVTP